ncbi:MAG: response regulator transcription factor [Thermoanaerobaculia bacterium]|nr:response regulator transcription factor [Thermoanaerobaculia bacterium]
MSRVLLVEDDRSLGTTLTERLRKEGFETEWATTLDEGIRAFDNGGWDVVILDVGLPDGSGFDLARRIKSVSSTPIMFMTAMSSAENRLEGFEIGADEFIPKPFHLKELFIRVRHVLETHADRKLVSLGDKTIDLQGMAIINADGTREYPQSRDFQVLQLLIEAAPNVVSRDEILDRVWGEDRFPSQRTVDNAVLRLRQALGEESAGAIRSVRGIGYQWAGIEGADHAV